MKWLRALLIPLLFVRTASGQDARPAPSCVVRASLDGVVNTGTADYLAGAVDDATRSQCTAVLVVLDTPGGSLDATRAIVRTFLSSPVPVVVYVAPGGARAGSAGAFITMAAHVAAMAPGANIGASHPVVGMGKDPEEAGGKHIAEKVENDAAAFARAIAEQRGRNVEWAEAAVRESVSATAGEAKDAGVIDLIAASEAELLAAIDGRVVTVAGDREVRLRTAGAAVQPFDMTIRQRALAVLGDPNLAYLLLMMGFLGILIEFSNPGLVIPGVVGAFALLLAAIGLNALPVSIGAVVLLVAAVVMFVAEVYVVSHGMLTIGGIACLLLGSALLLDRSDPDFFADPSVGVSVWAVAPVSLVLAFAAVLLAWYAARSRKRVSSTGSEGLLGEDALAVTGVTRDAGWVRAHGERWQARSDTPIAPGARARILEVRGLTLRVRPVDQTDDPAGGPADPADPNRRSGS